MSAQPTAESFEAYRPLLFAIAYRMLGSAAEAEDVVQDTYLRYHAVPHGSIRSLRAFLSTVVTRLCLNRLESARATREQYLGPWLPEPVLTGEASMFNPARVSPAHQAELHDSIALAFLVVLERLTPVERAVLLLRAVFDYEYAEIAEIVERDEAACRQIFSRARQHLVVQRPRFQSTPEAHRRLLTEFMQAVSTGELEGLLALLANDVTLWADGGGRARGAATQPLHGPAAVAQFVLASTRYLPSNYRAELAEVNGQLAAILRAGGRAVVVITIEVDHGRIRAVRVIGNPDKLARV